MQGEDEISSFFDGEIGGKNLNKYINQCAFLAEWNLFYQLLCWFSQMFWQPIAKY